MLDWPRPAVIAHRGASAHAPENTLAAFELAVQQGADAVEFDVKLTADGQVVVLHDQTVDRTTDGRGDLRAFSLAALRELDAGARFSEQFRGQRVPTLEEVFETVGRRVRMNIELTNYATPLDSLVPAVVALVRRFGLEKQVLFSSFFPHNLRQAKRLLPEVPCGLLTWAGWMGWWGRAVGFRAGVYQAIHPNLQDVDAARVRRWQAAGRRVHVWTVNAEADLARLFAEGVDGVFTDDPALALRLLGRGK